MAKEKRVAALDSCALSFYQQGSSPACDDDTQRRRAAKIGHFMDRVRGEGGDVILPAVAMAEYLAYYPLDARPGASDTVHANYKVIDFGVEAALAFADLRGDKEAFAAARKNSDRSKEGVKVDYLIAATAIAFNATELLTHNTTDFTSFAGKRLKVVDVDELPDPPSQQPTLPGLKET